MTAPVDVLTFVRARLDEDETTALATYGVNDLARRANGEEPPGWTVREPRAGERGGLRVVDDRTRWAEPTVRVGHTWRTEAEHIVRQNPARVLRRVAAMRAALDLATDAEGLHSDAWQIGKGIARALAAEWADHPDYRQEWAA